MYVSTYKCAYKHTYRHTYTHLNQFTQRNKSHKHKTQLYAEVSSRPSMKIDKIGAGDGAVTQGEPPPPPRGPRATTTTRRFKAFVPPLKCILHGAEFVHGICLVSFPGLSPWSVAFCSIIYALFFSSLSDNRICFSSVCVCVICLLFCSPLIFGLSASLSVCLRLSSLYLSTPSFCL